MELEGKNTSHLSASFYFLIIGSCFFLNHFLTGKENRWVFVLGFPRENLLNTRTTYKLYTEGLNTGTNLQPRLE